MKILPAINLQHALPHLPLLVAIGALCLQTHSFQVTQTQWAQQFHQAKDQWAADKILAVRQSQGELAMNLWNDWERVLTVEVSQDFKRLTKWLKGYPPEGSNDSPGMRQSHADWLKLFITASALDTETYQTLLSNIPDHVRSAFLPKDKKATLSISDIERIRNSTVKSLNLIEKICCAYICGLADRDLLDYAFKGSVVSMTVDAGYFIEVWRSKEGRNVPDAWQAITDLVTASDGAWHAANKPAVKPVQADAFQRALDAQTKAQTKGASVPAKSHLKVLTAPQSSPLKGRPEHPLDKLIAPQLGPLSETPEHPLNGLIAPQFAKPAPKSPQVATR